MADTLAGDVVVFEPNDQGDLIKRQVMFRGCSYEPG